MMSNTAEFWYYSSLSVLYNYFDNPTKLFSNLHLAKFFNISAKLFFSCTHLKYTDVVYEVLYIVKYRVIFTQKTKSRIYIKNTCSSRRDFCILFIHLNSVLIIYRIILLYTVCTIQTHTATQTHTHTHTHPHQHTHTYI